MAQAWLKYVSSTLTEYDDIMAQAWLKLSSMRVRAYVVATIVSVHAWTLRALIVCLVIAEVPTW